LASDLRSSRGEENTRVAEKDRFVKILLISALVVVVTLLQYSTELSEHRYHLLYQGLFFLPVMLAGFWLGLRIALATSLSITLLLLPFTFLHWHSFSAGDFNNIMELVLYNAVALILGIIKGREQEEQNRLREAQRLATMGQTASALAHDMKTAAIAIGGFSRLLRKRSPDDPAYGERLGLIIAETQRLEALAENMLDFSRPLELHCSRQDMNEIVKQSLAILSQRTQEKKVLIQSKISPNLSQVFLDPLRLSQVLINLLLNAVEASPEGEPVELLVYPRRKNLVIDVRDRGCGLPPGKKEKIFSPFFTTKSKGNGLGLPIVLKIVQAHQGILQVLESPVKGLTFRVAIPLQPGPA
jgi:two-component system sensor histidine kinase HydH